MSHHGRKTFSALGLPRICSLRSFSNDDMASGGSADDEAEAAAAVSSAAGVLDERSVGGPACGPAPS